ncbi:hypothetical protein DORLON_01854 [Dorea longicatena DSM 13814]|uniref:Uncharacterized protein n=1 Tax=Dorea longicatena DSM 13814 TaxID=411462 RepID=A6BHS8_9FIRM|nr:hypothetical protein DORLON_01854 [Dorea longicatena DSM 13814]
MDREDTGYKVFIRNHDNIGRSGNFPLQKINECI